MTHSALLAAFARQAMPYQWGRADCVQTALEMDIAAGRGGTRLSRHPHIRLSRKLTEARALAASRMRYGTETAALEVALLESGWSLLEGEPRPGEICMLEGVIQVGIGRWYSAQKGPLAAFISPTHERLAWTTPGLQPASGWTSSRRLSCRMS